MGVISMCNRGDSIMTSKRFLCVFLCAVVFIVPSAFAADMEMWFLWADGSAGTGTLIRSPNGTVVLFDEGGGADWAAHCKTLMEGAGITYIDYAIAGHYDTDHVGGLDNLNDLMGGDSNSGYAPNFGVFMDRGGSIRDDNSAIPSDYYDFVTQSGKRETVSVSGSSDIDLGDGAVLQFLSVGAEDDINALYIRDGATVTTAISENNKSISVLVTYNGFDLYLGSDLEGSGELAVDGVIAYDLSRNVDVMLVDHHGSDTYNISSTEFLETLMPEVAIISVWGNSHGHPRYDTVTRLQNVVEADDQRIIRLMPGDTVDPDWAPENMDYCMTSERHIYILTNGTSYTVDTISRSGGNDITDPDLTNHATDEGIDPTPLPTPEPGTDVVINQVCPFSSPGEYVELYNPGTSPINLGGYVLNVYSGDYTFTADDVIPAGGYYLISDTASVNGVTPDVVTSIGITDNGLNSFAQLIDDASNVMDTVGWSGSSLYEGTLLGTLSTGKAWIRDFDGVDTDNNVDDFSAYDPDPRNSSTGGNPTSTPTPTNTPVPSTSTPTPTPTNTPIPSTSTPTPTPTNTLIPPTSTPTNTPVPPTDTPIPPTDTPTSIPPTNTPTPVPSGGVVVNQVCPFSSPGEYVELYNSGSSPVNLEGWRLNVYLGDYTFTASDVIPAGGFLLISDTDPVAGMTADILTNIEITDNDANSYAQLLDDSDQVVDTVGWKRSTLYESSPLGRLATGKAWTRLTDGVDTDDNAADFISVDPNPRNSGGVAPTPTSPPPTNTPTFTPEFTPTPTNTPEFTPTPTNTPEDTPTPTSTPTEVPPTNTPVGGWTVLTFDDFESGWGNYTDGGRDCALYTDGAYAPQGNAAANIQENNGIASSFYLTNGIDVQGYSEIKIDFSFIAVSMETSDEDFWVQYFDGSIWQTVADYDTIIDFNNDLYYQRTVIISDLDYTFPSDMQVRFMCDAGDKKDDVYIDEIMISAL